MAATGGGLLGVTDWARGGSNPADPLSLMASAQPPAVFATVAETSLPPTDYTFHSTVPEVRLQFTVTDAKGKLVQGLRANNVRVLDQSLEVQHFDEFTQDFDLPLRLGVVLERQQLGEETGPGGEDHGAGLPEADHASSRRSRLPDGRRQ